MSLGNAIFWWHFLSLSHRKNKIDQNLNEPFSEVDFGFGLWKIMEPNKHECWPYKTKLYLFENQSAWPRIYPIYNVRAAGENLQKNKQNVHYTKHFFVVAWLLLYIPLQHANPSEQTHFTHSTQHRGSRLAGPLLIVVVLADAKPRVDHPQRNGDTVGGETLTHCHNKKLTQKGKSVGIKSFLYKQGT